MKLRKLSFKIGSVFLVIGLALVCSIIAGYGDWGTVTEIAIQPLNPTDQDSIQITVSGEWGNPCFEITSSHSISENVISIDVTITQQPGICAQVVTPWSVTESIGIPPAGDYHVETFLNDTLSHGLASFTVTRVDRM